MKAEMKKTMETTWVSAALLKRNPHNRKPKDEAVGHLMESIRQVGVLQPITVRPVAGERGEDLEIVMGERRWEACRRIDPDFEVPVMVRRLDDKETARLLAVENFQREDLDPVEEARAIEHMRSTGWTMEEISEAVGRGKEAVRRSLKILDLPPEGLAAVHDGEMAVEVAATIAGLPADLRSRAIRDCVEPVASSMALTKREALEMLREVYLEPLRRRDEWESRRGDVENEWPSATWLEYDEARALTDPISGWEDVMTRPEGWRLAASYGGEVPTWLELARRHGGELRIGCSRDGAAVAMVEVEPLVDAEKAAHAGDPTGCCFTMCRADEAPGTAEDHEERRRDAAEAKASAMAREKALEAEKLELARKVRSGVIDPGFLEEVMVSAVDAVMDGNELAQELLGDEEVTPRKVVEELLSGSPGEAAQHLCAFLLGMEVMMWGVGSVPFRRWCEGLVTSGHLEDAPELRAELKLEAAEEPEVK